jgi:NAD(P)-dependent dehydrogenase (short-subunit alcohol dehydrogenase family)
VNFAGKTVVVTGGGSGLGRAMAEHLASLGGAIVVAGRRADPLAETTRAIEGRGGRAHPIVADVRDPEQVAKLFGDAAARFGRIDCLINNAAGNFVCPTKDLTPNGWKSVIDIVLNGTFNCSRAAGNAMIADGKGGAILNIVASYAWTGAPATAHSAAAKAGVISLTQTLASEWGAYRIRTNALSPGIVNTPGSAKQLFPTEAARERIKQRVPLRRLGTEAEVAAAAAFLLSDEAAYVNGAVLVADGGLWLNPGLFDVDALSGARPPR